jgi:hypothetical protein
MAYTARKEHVMPAETTDTAAGSIDIPAPLATAILDRLFAIEERLRRLEESPTVALQLERQARALLELRTTVEQAKALFREEQRMNRTAFVIYMEDPGRPIARA